MSCSSETNQKLKKEIAQIISDHKKEKTKLLQKIQHLEYENEELKRHEIETKKLNETVISSYKNTDFARDQMLQTSLQDLNKNHKEEIQKMVEGHAKTINTLESQIKRLKEKLETNNEIQQHARIQIQKGAQIRLEQVYKKQRQVMQNQLKDSKNRVSVLESKLRKSEQLVKTYKQTLQKLDCQVQRNEIVKNASMHYSFLFDKRKQEEELMMSKFYKSKRESQQSRMMRSQTNILHQADLRTHDRRQRQKQNTTTRGNRRISIEEVSESARKSKRYLDVTRESLDHLTTKLTRAVLSLQKIKPPSDRKISDMMNQRLSRKLRLR